MDIVYMYVYEERNQISRRPFTLQSTFITILACSWGGRPTRL